MGQYCFCLPYLWTKFLNRRSRSTFVVVAVSVSSPSPRAAGFASMTGKLAAADASNTSLLTCTLPTRVLRFSPPSTESRAAPNAAASNARSPLGKCVLRPPYCTWRCVNSSSVKSANFPTPIRMPPGGTLALCASTLAIFASKIFSLRALSAHGMFAAFPQYFAARAGFFASHAMNRSPCGEVDDEGFHSRSANTLASERASPSPSLENAIDARGIASAPSRAMFITSPGTRTARNPSRVPTPASFVALVIGSKSFAARRSSSRGGATTSTSSAATRAAIAMLSMTIANAARRHVRARIVRDAF